MTLRLPIRAKMLLAIVSVLLLAMGAYLWLATSLFRGDKRAYVFDLQAALLASLADQTASELTVLQENLALFGRECDTLGSERAAEELFKRRSGLLRVEMYAREGDDVRRLAAAINHDAGDGPHGLSEDDLQLMRKLYPVAFAAVAAGEIWLQNSSLRPKSAVVTLAVPWVHRGQNRILLADLEHERLLRIFTHSDFHTTYLLDQHGYVLAHPNAENVIEHTRMSDNPLVQQAIGSHLDKGVKEYVNAAGVPMIGGFARVGVGRLSVMTELPRREALKASHELVNRSLLFGVAIVLAAFIVSIFFSRLLTAPIRRLRAATVEIGRGNYAPDLRIRSSDEIGDLARSVAEMAQAIQSAQAALIQSEKLAAFGQLGAGIAHEVKNPIASILGYAQLGKGSVDDPEQSRDIFDIIERESKRCGGILNKLLRFARDERNGPHDRTQVDLNQVAASASKLFKHQLQINRVRLTLALAKQELMVCCHPDELQQVLLNLAINAQQAMPEGGSLRIETAPSGDVARLRVIDDGPGMSPEVTGHIFEPFFTTKPEGEGTGLGLSVSFGIIRDHGGSIAVASASGEGTTFTIELPLSTHST